MEHKRYLLLVNFNSEGWSIYLEADDPKEFLECITSGISSPWLIVKVIPVTVQDDQD